ncbi:MAG TPA: chloride channel protein, partial [Polyangiaceae bacterium]|nr:chloride channel protein [Polyangiaceae bacterium]
MLDENAPLDLRIVGRTLLQAALVGVAAGIAGALFFSGLEYFQRFALELLAGYTPLRADGESFAASEAVRTFRPWLLVLLPAVGGLCCGLLTLLAPEVRGGGGDAMIEAFHHGDGAIRPRVIGVKALASMFTLGTGGAGGREGPTMQIGGALGSWVAGLLRVSARERRILMVAGVAAGISAVFRTPLGAALLAVEVLYKDGFESDALIPSVLASVVAYSVIISIFGQSTLFA